MKINKNRTSGAVKNLSRFTYHSIHNIPEVIPDEIYESVEHFTKIKGLTDKNTTFNGFKSGLLKHYKSALRNVYNAEDPRTWKSICLSCNTSRNLSCPISCCS